MRPRILVGLLTIAVAGGIIVSAGRQTAQAANGQQSKAAASPGHKPWAYGKGPYYSKPWAYGSPPYYQSPPKQSYPVVPAVPYGYGWPGGHGTYYGSPGAYYPPPYNGYIYPPQIYHWTPFGLRRSF